MKKLFYFFVVFISCLFVQDVNANSVSSITMDIYIDSSGTAHVKEVWNANLTSGTEGYKPYYNIGNSEFVNFKVTDGSNVYTNIGSWSTGASFNDKAYKNGINYINNGLELCFGISSYGYHNYILEYDITNFVDGLNDADAVYWTLFPYDFSVSPNSVYIKIYADQPFSDDLDVWGYGNYGGYAYVYDGYIEMSTNGSLSSNEYMTILAKFPKGTFDTTNTKVNKNFSDYLTMAEEGAEHYENSSGTTSIVLMTIVLVIFEFFLNPVTIIIFVIFYIKNTYRGLGMYKWKFNKGEKKLPRNVPLYRDIPFNKDIYKVYFLANLYGLAKNKNDLLGAVLLKWIKEGKIEIIKVTSSILKREETALKFKDGFITDYSFELELYNIMHAASKDGILEAHELDKWCKQNYSRMLKWFDTVIAYETNWLMNNGQIESIGSLSGDKRLIKTSLYEDAKVVKGLKQFLIEFSKIDNREAIEVINWQEYLIIAQILGIADKVAKQFKKLYPEIITDYNYDNIMFVRNVSVRGVRSATYARSQAQARSSSYSSGGGGRSSGGGGGGSRGGGGGGGGFR